MKIYIDCDHYGISLKKEILSFFNHQKIKIIDLDFGIDKPYPLVANHMALQLLSAVDSRGILICNSGIGMSIVANKYAGIYANNCSSLTECEAFRKVNNGNLLCLGAQFVSTETAIELSKTFLFTDFDNKNQMRIELIESIFQ